MRFRLCIIFLFLFNPLFAQEEYTTSQIDSLCNLAEIAFGTNDFRESLNFAEEALKRSEEIDYPIGELRASFYVLISVREEVGEYTKGINDVKEFLKKLSNNGLNTDVARAHQHLANCYDYIGDVNKMMEENLLALNIFEEMGNKRSIAAIWRSMTLTFYNQQDYESAFEYGRKALDLDLEIGNDRTTSANYNNLAIIFEQTGPIDSAIFYHKLSLELSRKNNNDSGIGNSLSNLGHNYILKGEYKLAESTLLEALNVRSKIGNARGLANTHNRLANLYLKIKEYGKASSHAQLSMEFARQTGEINIKIMAYDRLAEIAEMTGNASEEAKYLKMVLSLKDSILNERNTEDLTRMVMNYDFQKQLLLDSLANKEREQLFLVELEKERNRRNLFMISGIFFLLLAIGLFHRSWFIKKSRTKLEKEKHRSDALLLNILPAEVAEELKEKGYYEAKDFSEVTVVFTDFADFTRKAHDLSAKELVMELNICFKKFDEIVTEFGLEKIKTIGDAYMAAAGLNKKSGAKEVVLAALAMQEFIFNRNKELAQSSKVYFDMRCGINTGPVVAGIVGIKKFQYDIWGDSVNTAQRMEVNCELNKVNISANTYELLKDDPEFEFESRPEVPIKGKGMMKMYYVCKAG